MAAHNRYVKKHHLRKIEKLIKQWQKMKEEGRAF